MYIYINVSYIIYIYYNYNSDICIYTLKNTA
jgi:hypothetical protein